MKKVFLKPKTSFKTTTAVQTHVVTQAGGVRTVRTKVVVHVPVVSTKLVTVNGKTKTLVTTRLIPTTAIQTQTNTLTRVQTQTQMQVQTADSDADADEHRHDDENDHRRRNTVTNTVTTTHTVTQPVRHDDQDGDDHADRAGDGDPAGHGHGHDSVAGPAWVAARTRARSRQGRRTRAPAAHRVPGHRSGKRANQATSRCSSCRIAGS